MTIFNNHTSKIKQSIKCWCQIHSPIYTQKEKSYSVIHIPCVCPHHGIKSTIFGSSAPRKRWRDDKGVGRRVTCKYLGSGKQNSYEKKLENNYCILGKPDSLFWTCGTLFQKTSRYQSTVVSGSFPECF